MAPWSLAVYLDDVPAGQWACGSEASAYIHVATQGANELVLVGVGPDEHYVILGDARLFPSRQQVPKKRRHGTHRRRLLEFDDRLLVDSLALLTARTSRDTWVLPFQTLTLNSGSRWPRWSLRPVSDWDSSTWQRAKFSVLPLTLSWKTPAPLSGCLRESRRRQGLSSIALDRGETWGMNQSR